MIIDIFMKPLIVANWKMNPISRKQAEHLFESIRKEICGIQNVEVVLCPPFIYLDFISKKTSKDIKLGGQNIFWDRQGPYTGEISPQMLKDIGCDYVILGHSERKKNFKETSEIINKKIKAVIKSRLKIILCVGEESRNSFDKNGRWTGEVDLILREQVLQCLEDIDEPQIANIIIAYEPIWAISTTENGCVATPNDALSASLLIRKTMHQKYNEKIARSLRILYGGSVDSKNAIDFMKEDGIDGVLVGGARRNSSEFVRLVKAVSGQYLSAEQKVVGGQVVVNRF